MGNIFVEAEKLRRGSWESLASHILCREEGCGHATIKLLWRNYYQHSV